MTLSRRLLFAVLIGTLLLVSACNAPGVAEPPKVATLTGATFTPQPVTPTSVPTTPAPLPTDTATVPAPTAAPTITPTVAVETATVTADDTVNVRSGPGTGYAILGQLTTGQTVEAIGRNADSSWWQIVGEYGGNTENRAWVFGQLVTPNAAAAGLPVVDVAPPPTAPPQPTSPPAATQPPGPTPTPAAGNLYPAPTLLKPDNDAYFFGGPDITIWLTWNPMPNLQPGDCYELSIVHSDGVYVTCLTDTSWQAQAWLFDHRPPTTRDLHWSVRIVRNGTPVSPSSEQRVFHWFG
jgi:hypothetical protein